MAWLSRCLLVGPNLCMVMSQREYEKALKERGIEYDGAQWLPDGCKAMVVSILDNEHGELFCIVCVHPDALNADGIDVAASMAHESVHVWQRVKRHTSYDDPDKCWGTESEAYAIENIFRNLMMEMKRRMEAK